MATSIDANQKTIQNIIDETSKKTSGRKTGELGKSDFLNLLVTQLKYQDPMNPVDDKEFIGQMAQFSGLEQMQNLNTSFTSQKAYSMVGKYVKASVKDETTGVVNDVSGYVTKVKIASGKTTLMVNNKEVPVDSVVELTEGNLANVSNGNLTQYTNLIGYNAKGYIYNSDDGKIAAVNGNIKSIAKGSYEDYAVMDDVEAVISQIDNDKNSTDKDYIKNYLELYKDKEINVKIKDPESGDLVNMTATLKSYTIGNDYKIKGIFDNVKVPVESIRSIKPNSIITESNTTDTKDSSDTNDLDIENNDE